MTTVSVELTPLVDQLIEILDETIALQQEIVEQLPAASHVMVTRDEAAMAQLMDDLGRMELRLEDVARRRSAVRSRLAAALNCPVGEVSLESLARLLPEPLSSTIHRRRRSLRRLAETVRRRHLETAVLLAEMVRVNRSLLHGLFPKTDGAEVYRTDGTTHWQPGRALFDARL